jgi:ABC-2 type transport system permease protein
LSGRNLFVFLQGGLLLFVFNGTALGRPVNAVTRDLTNGTLEYLYTVPASRYAYFVGTIISSAVVNLALFLPLYVFLILYSNASLVNMLMVLLVCLVALTAIVAMGIMIALFAILWRQAASITAFLGLLFEFLSGTYFPISVFPPFIRFISYCLPYTWAYDLIRYYSFEGQWRTSFPIWIEWTFLIAYSVLFTLISRFLLKKTEQLAKKSGLHIL